MTKRSRRPSKTLGRGMGGVSVKLAVVFLTLQEELPEKYRTILRQAEYYVVLANYRCSDIQIHFGWVGSTLICISN